MLNTGQPCPALDVTLECGDGNEFSFRDPLIEQERAALLEKMDAYCLEQAGLPLTDFRARYLAEEQQPHQAPGLAQLRACHWPRVGPVCRFLAEAGPSPPGRKTAPLGPVSPRFGAFDFRTRIKGGGRKRPPPAHKAPQCGAFLRFRYRRR